ncbi:formate dehydrogenase accessory protein FdhE [Desulfovibrio inopinatus]|uniref:formate dehydrogenase accessory protein FdhE n=1 Tax=Desulfovibrio inopinatus TaxID=102109 RepID=UPI000429599A|nr:formate dehydrogenase accessory protein FdhE [Desulfovibrio inopinatus]
MQQNTTRRLLPESVRVTIDRYCAQRPAQKDILEAFAPLLETRSQLEAIFVEEPLELDIVDQARHGQGVPLLSDINIDVLMPWISRSADTILPVLLEMIPDNRAITAIADALKAGRLDLKTCCLSRISNDGTSLQKRAEAAGLDAGTLAFVIDQVLGAPVGALAQKINAMLADFNWNEGYCPICGTLPSYGTLSRPEPTELDALVGGGGQKHLHCALCGNTWRYRRDACPACGNSHPGTREIYHAEKATQERIEVCSKCNSYFPCIDLREYETDPHGLVVPLALMHLDLIAAQNQLRPLVPAPWNTFS